MSPILGYEPENIWYNYCIDTDPKVIQDAIIEDYIKSNDRQIHLDIYGRDENLHTTVIFIHGTAVYSRFYADFLYGLYQKGYRVVAPDLPGHGLSAGIRGHFDMKLLTSTIFDVTTYVIEQFGSSVVIMGSSLGGITSLYCIANDDRIKAGICHNAAILSEGAHKRIVKVGVGYRILKPLVPMLARIMPTFHISVWTYLNFENLYQDKSLQEKMDFVLTDKLISDKYTLRALATQMRASLARPIEEIETPIMILNSDNDVLFSVEYMQEIFNRLEKSGNKRLEIIRNAAHLVLQEKKGESLEKIINWLNEVL